MNEIKLSSLMSHQEANELRKFIAKRRESDSAPHAAVHHNIIMLWLDTQPEILERWKKLKLLPAYAAYLVEYYLQIK